ncbi:ketopantoate reductase family protein [Cytobacillus massiliigabonensis]|uniref:ketopantoate reductase family protein n=1 Tax=Cytobacillus massiliigabonensis TaxID=1871011 RepID=UPI000C81FB55|nr:ketopantoate reductase family protein [Cytobacillus massiliigabonensis]
MRILVVGAGAIGGYFGGRLIEKGEDVTFLVREKRKQQLDQDGLIIESIHGDLKLKPKTILSGDSADPFDVILVSTKAYQLKDAMEGFRAYVNENTMILPLLNGYAHLDRLISEFGEERVLGGLCFIESTLDHSGKILQTSPAHDLVFGERTRKKTNRILSLQASFSDTKAAITLSENIEQDMWHKYLFITTFSGVTSLLRSPIGPIREQEYGLKTVQNLLNETAAIMREIDAPIDNHIEETQMNRILGLSYGMKSSLQRDMEKQQPTEADHFFGYLLQHAKEKGIDSPLLSAIYANLAVYGIGHLSLK